MAYVLGCDPGKEGAIVAVSDDPDVAEPLVILRTPHMASARGKGEVILYDNMWAEFERLFGNLKIRHAFIERVGAQPHDGGPQAFKFGYSAGFLYGMIVASKIPRDMVEPQAWKATAKIKHGAAKEGCIPRACELWPEYSEELTPKRNHWTKAECIGVCDSALIGYHGLTLLGKVPVAPAIDNPFDL